jgi:hypothetical protein
MRLWRYFRSDNMMAKQSGSNETEKKHNPKKTRKQDVNEKKKNEECFAQQRHVRLLLGIIVGSGTFNSNMYHIVF